MPAFEQQRRDGAYQTSGWDEPNRLSRAPRPYAMRDIGDDTPRDFPARNVIMADAMMTDLTGRQVLHPVQLPSRTNSTTSSMAVRFDSMQSNPSTYSARTPSLCSGSTASSSVSTWESQSRIVPYRPLLDAQALLLQNHVPCEWYFVNCEETKPAGDDWHDHSKDHFYGHEPPQAVSCPFKDCVWIDLRACGHDAWQRRREHIDSKHSSCRGPFKRISRHFAQHLKIKQIVTPAECKDLISQGRILSQGPISMHHGGRHRN